MPDRCTSEGRDVDGVCEVDAGAREDGASDGVWLLAVLDDLPDLVRYHPPIPPPPKTIRITNAIINDLLGTLRAFLCLEIPEKLGGAYPGAGE